MLVGPHGDQEGRYGRLINTYALIEGLFIPQPQFFFEDFDAVDKLENLFGNSMHDAMKRHYAEEIAGKADLSLYEILRKTSAGPGNGLTKPKRQGKFPFATIEFFNNYQLCELKNKIYFEARGIPASLAKHWNRLKEQYNAWEPPPSHYEPHSIINVMNPTHPDGVARRLLHECPEEFNHDIIIRVSTMSTGSKRTVPKASVEYDGVVYFTVKPAFEDPMYNRAGKKFEVDIKEPKRDILLKTLNDYLRLSSGIIT